MSSYENLWGQESHHIFAPRLPHGSVLEHVKTDCACDDWVQKLASSFNSSDTTDAERVTHSNTQQTIVFWIKQLFSNFNSIVYQFNSRADNEHLWIDCSDPQFHRVTCDEHRSDGSYESSKLYFEGHLASRNEALLIRGFADEIDAFLVPSAVWLGISMNSLDEHDYPPFARIKVNGMKDAIIHLSETKKERQLTIESSSIPLLARLLFSRLIEYSMPNRA